MTDREIMLHRFAHKNLKRSTGELAKYLGMTRQDYEDAVKRSMEEEAKELKAKTLAKNTEEMTCDICGKPIKFGYMTDDSGSFCTHEGKCFKKYMNGRFGKHRWMGLGIRANDGENGYYIYADDTSEKGYGATGIFYTELEG